MDLHASLATCADAAFASDVNGVIVAWNAAAERLTGMAASSVLGRPCADVIAGRDENGNLHCMINCGVRRLLDQGEAVHRFPLHLATPAGALDVSVLVLRLAPDDGDEVIVHVLEPLAVILHQEGVLAAGRVARSPAGQLGAHAHNSLTGREIEVLRLLTQGADTRRIARRLSISRTTARTHVQHILDKLDVHSQVQAVVYALRHGLI